MLHRFKVFMALLFALLFFALSAALAGLALFQFVTAFSHEELISGFIRALNTSFISLATFELAVGISKEYASEERDEDVYGVVRRTISRFVAVVATAMVLEGLVMTIKYSQLDLAGNLYYPVAIVTSAAILLIALGVFLYLSRGDCPRHRVDLAEEETPQWRPRYSRKATALL